MSSEQSEQHEKIVRCRVYGCVQGVGFRFTVWRQALKLGITGYVRNCDDGTVEVAACGTPEQIDTLIDWIKAGGPRSARVDELTVTAFQPQQRWQDFSIRY